MYVKDQSQQAPTAPTGNRFLKRGEVQHKTGLSCASIYAAMGKGTFPTPVTITPGRVAWLEVEINEWIQRRKERHRTVLHFSSTPAHK